MSDVPTPADECLNAMNERHHWTQPHWPEYGEAERCSCGLPIVECDAFNLLMSYDAMARAVAAAEERIDELHCRECGRSRARNLRARYALERKAS